MREERRARWQALLDAADACAADPWREDLDGGPDDAATALGWDAYEDDLRNVFGRSWLLACRASDVARVGDWRRFDVGRARVVVTRAESGLQALANVCLHRGSTLVADAAGRSERLRCPYHGLGWGLDGSLVSAPPSLGMGPPMRPGAACLPRFRVDTWGGFVFVSLDPAAPPLAEFLGPLPLELDGWPFDEVERRFSESFEVPISWRVAVEGFLEPLHLPFLHARTVQPFVDHRRGAMAELGDHSLMISPWRLPGMYDDDGAVGRGAAKAGVAPFRGLDALQRGHNYTALLFPNVTLNLMPNHLTVAVATPLTRESTRIEFGFYALAAPPSADEWFRGAVDNARRIGNEDFGMLARVQEGLASGHVTGLHRSSADRRIRHFHRRLAAWNGRRPAP